MRTFIPWSQHPRACVLAIGLDYDQTSESERVKATCAAMLANVWIFNARTRARKEVPMGVFVDKGHEFTPDGMIAYLNGQPFLPKGIEVIKKSPYRECPSCHYRNVNRTRCFGCNRPL
ncbi:hypothetical protein D3C76_407190 [compost metagenome]